MTRVVLYKNGVGYFEHAGHVRGNQDVNVDFTTGQLNDVLKSLTVLDLGKDQSPASVTTLLRLSSDAWVRCVCRSERIRLRLSFSTHCAVLAWRSAAVRYRRPAAC